MSHRIVEYKGRRDEEIAAFILGIQNDEAGLELTMDEQPDLADIADTYREGGFWIALDGGRLIGTIGLLQYGRRGAIKRFFVSPDRRGRGGPARPLFDRALDAARSKGCSNVFLDTPRIATRSHAFYLRAGLQRLSPDDLPRDYAHPDRDSLIFGLQLT